MKQESRLSTWAGIFCGLKRCGGGVLPAGKHQQGGGGPKGAFFAIFLYLTSYYNYKT